MSPAAQFPFVDLNPAAPGTKRLPYLPIALVLNGQSLELMALLDSGSTINVLPWSVGLQLGADWQQQTVPVPLTGILSAVEARVLHLTGSIASFAPVRLAFAWTNTDSHPIILGQVNFFLEFDVCFFRARSVFEVKPK